MFQPYISPVSELCHHGIKGMRWGVRRYQNPDGSLTEEGRRRYLKGKSFYNYESDVSRKYKKKYGEDSIKYRKSVEFDDELAKRYLKDAGTLKGFAKQLILGGSTQRKTYEMSRATGRGIYESILRSQLDVSPAVVMSLATGALASALVRNFELTRSLAGAIEQTGNNTLKAILNKTAEEATKAVAEVGEKVSNTGKAVKALTGAGGIVIGAPTPKAPPVPVPTVSPKAVGTVVGSSASSKIAERMAADAQKMSAKYGLKKASEKTVEKISPSQIGSLLVPAGVSPASRLAGVATYTVTNTIPAMRGHEWSLQQRYLRNDYIKRGKRR